MFSVPSQNNTVIGDAAFLFILLLISALLIIKNHALLKHVFVYSRVLNSKSGN